MNTAIHAVNYLFVALHHHNSDVHLMKSCPNMMKILVMNSQISFVGTSKIFKGASSTFGGTLAGGNHPKP